MEGARRWRSFQGGLTWWFPSIFVHCGDRNHELDLPAERRKCLHSAEDQRSCNSTLAILSLQPRQARQEARILTSPVDMVLYPGRCLYYLKNYSFLKVRRLTRLAVGHLQIAQNMQRYMLYVRKVTAPLNMVSHSNMYAL